MPPVPSKQYDLFIKAYEKFVAERQEEIRKADRLMRVYEIVRGALERARLPNETKLQLTPDGVDVDIYVMEDDRRQLFADLLADIGRELQEARLHDDGIPAINSQGLYWTHTWRIPKIDKHDPPWVRVGLLIPAKGTRYIKVNKRERAVSYNTVEYSAEWHSGPLYPRKVKVTHAEKDEIPF